jgi:hypothetical protein
VQYSQPHGIRGTIPGSPDYLKQLRREDLSHLTAPRAEEWTLLLHGRGLDGRVATGS